MQRKKLPIGIQTFREIREEDYYYVDKTPLALQLIAQGKHYFLSRPRRFGKSLFLDTLKELFEGNRALFQGLYAEQHWDWSQKYPVIRLSLGARVAKTPDILVAGLDKQLSHLENTWGYAAHFADAPNRLADLIEKLHAQTGQRVVVLVDEYDKPMLDNLSEPDMAYLMRNSLRDLYAVLKDSDAHLKFVFITGVSKFSKVSLFSGLNNLKDITVDPTYSALCGYTDRDVDTVFAPELPGLERESIRQWYNGYRWRGESVYNPFDVLLLFDQREFAPYWFETGTPTFLVEFLAQRGYFTPDLMRLQTSEKLLSSFDVDYIAPEALLWQSGYLTIQHVEEIMLGHRLYTLGYPNREVESALNDALLPMYGADAQQAFLARSVLVQALQEQDLQQFKASFSALFASIPHDWYRNNPLAQYEGHYASVFYSQLAALGLDVRVEDATNKGRIDLSLRYRNHIYLFEFKVVAHQAEGKALQQLLNKGYAEKYRSSVATEEGGNTRPTITLIGIEFSRQDRNIVGFETCSL
jgi:hypothetical protein